MRLDKTLVRKTVEEHRKAQEIVQQEWAKRLLSLTPEEARKEFDLFRAIWAVSGAKLPSGQLDIPSLRFLIKRRRKFQALWKRWQQ